MLTANNFFPAKVNININFTKELKLQRHNMQK